MKEYNVKIIKKDYEKIKKLALKAYKRKCYEASFAYIELASHIMTGYQFIDRDKELERLLVKISDEIFERIQGKGNRGKVVIYDYQGLENRGLVWIYAEALVNIGYQVFYITYEEKKGRFHNLERCVISSGGKVYTIKEGSYAIRARQIINFVRQVNPEAIFVHTIPCDIPLLEAIRRFKDIKKYYINLEDHGFQLGLGFMDKIIEFRSYGFYYSRDCRGIDESKLCVLPFYPHKAPKEFQGFPFGGNGERFILSGGSTYKIEGSNYYEKIIVELLETYDDLYFIYAGNGKSEKLDRIISEFPGRAFHISEREDLNELMKHAFAYVSTYPIGGGLMYQYAASEGKIPLTLQDEKNQISDAKSFLQDTDLEGVVFYKAEDLCNEFKHLYEDRNYRETQEKKIKKTVIGQTEFENGIRQLMEYGTVPYELKEVHLDREYVRQMFFNASSYKTYCRYFLNRKRINLRIVFHFPMYCINSLVYRLRE